MDNTQLEEGHGPVRAAQSVPLPQLPSVSWRLPSDVQKKPPAQRLRAAVQAVQAMSGMPKKSLLRQSSALHLVPGLNRTNTKLGAAADAIYNESWHDKFADIYEECKVSIIDYSATSIVTNQCTNDDLLAFLSKERPQDSKVRWINVQGFSSDIIVALSKHYNLHRLVVEDLYEIPQRVKVDYYENYLFASLILLSLDAPTKDHSVHRGINHKEDSKHSCSNSSSNGAVLAGVEEGEEADNCSEAKPSTSGRKRAVTTLRTSLVGVDGEWFQDHKDLFVEQIGLFLIDDGAGRKSLISIFERDRHHVVEPIVTSLNNPQPTLLRTSEDASLLFHAIIDTLVDHAGPVVDWYATVIAQQEREVFEARRPKASYTKKFYLLGNELKALRKVFLPTETLVHNLIHHQSQNGTSAPLISNMAKTYLEDVNDHISTVVENIDTLSQQCKDLIDLVFNTLAHHTNQSMQLLTSASMVFLPITFLAGVYGMNFEYFPELKFSLGFTYFWMIAMTIAVCLVTMLHRMGMLDRSG